MALTLWGMGDAASDDPSVDGMKVWGHGRYAIDVGGDADTATLRLSSGDIELALQPLDEGVVAGDPSGLPVLSIELDQAALPEPGTRRTLDRDDFSDVRVRAVIDGAVFVDSAPRIDVALDLATGATTVTAEGLLRRVDGAEADDRPYAIAGEGISPIDCNYPPPGQAARDVPGSDGGIDTCRALIQRAADLPATADTPSLPWDPDAPEIETICTL